MVLNIRASSQLELVDMQLRLAKAHLNSTSQAHITEGYAAAVAAFTRANLIVSSTTFEDKNEGEQWRKLKMEAYSLQSAYESKLSAMPVQQAPVATTPSTPMVSDDDEKRSYRFLTDAEKETIKDFYARGMNPSVIAAQIGRSNGAVYNYLSRITELKTTNGR